MNDEEVTFDICKSIKQPSEYHILSYIDIVEETMASVEEMFSISESLIVVLLNYDGKNYSDIVAALGVGFIL